MVFESPRLLLTDGLAAVAELEVVDPPRRLPQGRLTLPFQSAADKFPSWRPPPFRPDMSTTNSHPLGPWIAGGISYSWSRFVT